MATRYSQISALIDGHGDDVAGLKAVLAELDAFEAATRKGVLAIRKRVQAALDRLELPADAEPDAEPANVIQLPAAE